MTLKLATVFSDNMVLQQGAPIPVWGTARPGARIRVELAGNTAAAVADRAGQWHASLPPTAAGGPHTLSVEGGKRVACENVMVGEVWVCSGQSNMEWPLASAANGKAETLAADYPNLRLLAVPRRAQVPAEPDVPLAWKPCSPDVAGGFTAVGYFFGRELHRKLGVPVGLINASWGGTIAEAWTSSAALAADAQFRPMLKEYHQSLRRAGSPGGATPAHRAWARQYDLKDTRNLGEKRGWHRPDADTAGWKSMDLPRNWQSAGHVHSGIFWFRRDVQVSAAWAGRDLTINLGAIDKSDVTYFNGERVGSLTMEQRPDAWCTPRTYRIPGRLVKPGRNVVAVRVFSNIFHGGFIGQPLQMALAPAGDAAAAPIPLAGDWAYAIEANFGLVPPPPAPPPGPGNPNSPHILFDNMIAPLLPYAIRGAIWYQGESNAGRARQYRALFPLMIGSWRDAWRQPTMPFLFVQLANYGPPPNVPADSAWAELREAQAMTLALPNTGMATAIDIGNPIDIHPANKQDVGLRLALPALRDVYGFDGLVASGPRFKSLHVSGGRARVAFDHVAGGLIARGGPLRGFAVAGRNRKFVWAKAKVVGREVLVWNPLVRAPVAVRYDWADSPAGNLYNASDLPAEPFRTDEWPGVTG